MINMMFLALYGDLRRQLVKTHDVRICRKIRAYVMCGTLKCDKYHTDLNF